MPEPNSNSLNTVLSRDAPPLVLASGSPRRLELLGQLGAPFEVVVSGADETIESGLDPVEQAIALAERKALAVALTLSEGLVLGADTIVVLDGQVLGKPVDDDEATSFLRRLSDRHHLVITGLSLIDASTSTVQRSSVSTVVRMRAFGDPDIAAYVATGEPRDKAGAYAIQGQGVALISGIEGCYSNVVGLPLCEVASLLSEAGVGIPASWSGCHDADGKICPRRV
jgi:septum formation protein